MKESLLKTPLGRLRVVGILEGISFLLLLGIAMPLKYKFGMPIAVKIAGSLHGGLFILFVFSLFEVKSALNWSFSKVVNSLIAALLPFGTFVLDSKLRKEQV